jgi:hypothetical protein
MEKKFLKWFDLVCEELPHLDKQLIIDSFKSGHVFFEEFEDKGFVCYMIINNFTKQRELDEMFVYLKPEFRNIVNLNKIIGLLENLAKKQKCDIIKIGANSRYKDDSFIKYLLRKGYKTDVVKKEVK